MLESIHHRLMSDPLEGCAVDYLDSKGIDGAAYACGKCSVLACRGTDGLTYTAEGECKLLFLDGARPGYLDN